MDTGACQRVTKEGIQRTARSSNSWYGCPFSLVFLGFSMPLDTLPYPISLQARWRKSRNLVMPRGSPPATEGPPHPWGYGWRGMKEEERWWWRGVKGLYRGDRGEGWKGVLGQAWGALVWASSQHSSMCIVRFN